jgi:hypothetical protein
LERYTLLALTGLATHDIDDDSGGNGEPEYITPEQVSQINKMLKDTASNNAAFLKFIGAESVEKILSAHFEKAITALKAKKPARTPGEEG